MTFQILALLVLIMSCSTMVNNEIKRGPSSLRTCSELIDSLVDSPRKHDSAIMLIRYSNFLRDYQGDVMMAIRNFRQTLVNSSENEQLSRLLEDRIFKDEFNKIGMIYLGSQEYANQAMQMLGHGGLYHDHIIERLKDNIRQNPDWPLQSIFQTTRRPFHPDGLEERILQIIMDTAETREVLENFRRVENQGKNIELVRWFRKADLPSDESIHLHQWQALPEDYKYEFMQISDSLDDLTLNRLGLSSRYVEEGDVHSEQLTRHIKSFTDELSSEFANEYDFSTLNISVKILLDQDGQELFYLLNFTVRGPNDTGVEILFENSGQIMMDNSGRWLSADGGEVYFLPY
jgi:hypothetical protein